MLDTEFKKTNSKFNFIYRVIILVFLGILTGLLIYYSLSTNFDWKTIALVSLFSISFVFCFIHYFLISSLKIKNTNKNLLQKFIKYKFIIKKYLWKKEIIVMKNNNVYIISNKEQNYELLNNFCKNNEITLTILNSFKKNFDKMIFCNVNTQQENINDSILLEFLLIKN